MKQKRFLSKSIFLSAVRFENLIFNSECQRQKSLEKEVTSCLAPLESPIEQKYYSGKVNDNIGC
jgi:hypothetical protein